MIEGNPYSFLFDGSLSFKKADRFARLIAPEAAERLRPQAIVAATLRSLAAEGHTIAAENEIADRVWRDFGLTKNAVASALESLAGSGVVKLAARGKPRAILFFSDDREPDVYGLSALIDAERKIETAALADGAEQPSPEVAEAIEAVILNAGALLRRPGFELDEDQADALRRVFAHRVSVVTGPPGSGKTAIVALANLIAAWRFRDMEMPICGVALAGRAASVLADNATVARGEGRILEFPAATIHRAFGLEVDGDADELDEPDPSKGITCGVLVIDEASMINAPLLAMIFERMAARHIVLVGDADQLDPIGPGSPFADMIARELAPVTRLFGNYRAEAPALRDLIASIRDGSLDPSGDVPLAWFVAQDGGVVYIPAAFGMRGHAAGLLWCDLIDGGASPHEIAVITPRNVGDDGTQSLNRDIRLALGLAVSPQVGDLLIVTKNDYRAIATPDHQGEPMAGDDDHFPIFNGERCEVVSVERDTIDVLFPATLTAPERRVRFLSNGDHPPEGTAFGYAMTAHKAQGSQFKFVILITARPDRFVSWASVYTAASRARERLFIVGDEGEFVASVGKDRPRRRTLLGEPVSSAAREA